MKDGALKNVYRFEKGFLGSRELPAKLTEGLTTPRLCGHLPSYTGETLGTNGNLFAAYIRNQPFCGSSKTQGSLAKNSKSKCGSGKLGAP